MEALDARVAAIALAFGATLATCGGAGGFAELRRFGGSASRPAGR